MMDKAARTLEGILNTITDSHKSNVDLGEPEIGDIVGTCKNCYFPVKIRQPWLSKMEEVNDGYYLIHCTNEACHNYSGVEIKLNELWVADFVDWDEKYIKKEQEVEPANIIPFDVARRRSYAEKRSDG